MTTYYVDGAVGNDGNAGTSEGAGNAWATIQHAFDTLAGNDECFIKASVTYAEALVFPGATAGNEVAYSGYTTTPGDGGKVTIDGTGNTNCVSHAGTTIYAAFLNFVFTGATGTGFISAAGDSVFFYNCDFHTNGSDGVQVDNFGTFVKCRAWNNGAKGFLCDTSAMFIGCIAYGNTNEQFSATAAIGVYKCVTYNGSGASVMLNIPQTGLCAANTVDGDGGNKTLINASTWNDNYVVDCILRDTLGTGVTLSGSFDVGRGFCGYNLFDTVTVDYAIAGVENIEIGDVDGSALFTDEAGRDYTLQSGSDAIDVGLIPGAAT
jgi:hypothetical protein